MLGSTHTRDAALFRPRAVEYRGVANATGSAFGILAIGDALLSLHGMQLLLLVALPSGLGLLVLSRWSWRRWLNSERDQGRLSARTLVVGDRQSVEHAVAKLEGSVSAGFDVIGVTLLDGNAREIIVGGDAYPAIGNVDTVSTTARDLGADTVVVASRPADDGTFVKRLSWQLEGAAIELVLANELTDVAGTRLYFVPL
jgi:hypothetical protein